MRISALALMLSVFVLASCAGPQAARGVRTDVGPGLKPWTSLAAADAPDRLQFAVMGDRAGGNRPGVFLDAVKKVNALQPQFVICVGDLIDGYSQEKAAIDDMYKDLAFDLSFLDRPFFFVGGNHDLGDTALVDAYKARFGKTYYHFVFQDCLFLVLDSEVPTEWQLSQAQVDWAAQVLKDNARARWTFVFLHKPLWAAKTIDSNTPETRWDQIEALLGDRPRTVFSGHEHLYTKYQRGGYDYYTLATTGGGLEQPESPTGSFDHIMWVTMGSDGPRVTPIALEGMLPNDIVTEQRRAEARLIGTAYSGGQFGIAADPVWFTPDATSAHAVVHLANNSSAPMTVRLSGLMAEGVAGAFEERRLVLDPRSTRDIGVSLVFARPLEDGPVVIPFQAWIESAFGNPNGPNLPVNAFLALDRSSYDIPPRTSPVAIDASLSEWESLPHVFEKPFQMPGAQTQPTASSRYAIAYDAQGLYMAFQIADDELQTLPGRYPWEQDSFEIRLDARPEPVRARSNGQKEFDDVLVLITVPGQNETNLFGHEKLPAGVRVASAPAPGGYIVEVAVPAAYLDRQSGKAWDGVRLNFTINDRDATRIDHHWWRPDWRTKQTYSGSGMFVKK